MITNDLFEATPQQLRRAEQALEDARNRRARQERRLAPAEARRDAGIEAAIKHAEAITPAWRVGALEWVQRYAAMCETPFLTEDVREYAQAHGFSTPADARAWGRVMRNAIALGYIVKEGTLPAKSSNLSPKVAWRKAAT